MTLKELQIGKSAVVDTVGGKQRACVDGPVFDARKVVW